MCPFTLPSLSTALLCCCCTYSILILSVSKPPHLGYVTNPNYLFPFLYNFVCAYFCCKSLCIIPLLTALMQQYPTVIIQQYGEEYTLIYSQLQRIPECSIYLCDNACLCMHVYYAYMYTLYVACTWSLFALYTVCSWWFYAINQVGKAVWSHLTHVCRIMFISLFTHLTDTVNWKTVLCRL